MNGVIVTKACKTCGTVFTTEWPRTAYCSDTCRHGEATCIQCGATFLKGKRTTGKFCSGACWYAHYRVVGKVAKTCPMCGATFHGEAATCSPTCGRAYQRRNHPNRRTTCEHCGGPLRPTVTPGRRFCSRTCSMFARNHQPGGKALPEGTKRAHSSGYVQVKTGKDWRMEHHVVMEQAIERPLRSDERVHHKNGVRHDNDPTNLELWIVKKKDPAGQRAIDMAMDMMSRLSPEDRQRVFAHFKL